MQWTQTKRGLAITTAVLLLTAGCGGDKGPTGPGGGGGDGPAGAYELVAVDRSQVPAVVQVEDCIPTRFQRGELLLNPDGTWWLELGFYDDNYQDGATASDDGAYVQEGSTVWLHSTFSGFTHQARVGGAEVAILYDWCYNGVPDVELVLER